MSVVAALLAAVLLVLARAGGASETAGQARFELGRTGGNIAQFSVVIRPDGTIGHSGPVRLEHASIRLSTARRATLLRYADTQGFWSLPSLKLCRDTLPDEASLYVTIHTAARTHRVIVRGTCSARFSQIYRRLAAAATVISR